MLVWTPCAFLWALAILDVFYMRGALNRNVPWGPLNLAKLGVTGALVVLTLVDLGLAVGREDADVFPVDFWTPAIKAMSFVSIDGERARVEYLKKIFKQYFSNAL